jgi:hypothetical protein
MVILYDYLRANPEVLFAQLRPKLIRKIDSRYLIDKRVATVNDINHKEAVSLFPDQTPSSLIYSLNVFSYRQFKATKPLYQGSILQNSISAEFVSYIFTLKVSTNIHPRSNYKFS